MKFKARWIALIIFIAVGASIATNAAINCVGTL